MDKSLRSNVYTSNRYIDPDPTLRTRYLLEGSEDGSAWFVLSDKRQAETNLPHDYLALDGVKLRYVRVTAEKLPYDEPFALSGLLLFYVILPWLAWLQKKLGEKAFSRIVVTLGIIILIDIAYNDIAAYMFGMPGAAKIYRDLGWF